MNYTVKFEGKLPEQRPLVLAPVHRAAVDMYAVSAVAGEFIAFVSTDAFGHGRVANRIQHALTTLLGSIVWPESHKVSARAKAVRLARDVDRRLDSRLILGIFVQGEYQPNSVETVEDGLIGLIKRYELRKVRIGNGREVIPIVPVGISYESPQGGLVQSKFALWLSKFVPLFPLWSVPARGTHITVHFGEPKFIGDTKTEELTSNLMQDAAVLSGIPFNKDS
jgi:1-acyl-sn-glycerol-3-phosphate acyltransferase